MRPRSRCAAIALSIGLIAAGIASHSGQAAPAVESAAAPESPTRGATRISIDNGRWLISGRVASPEAPTEGLLMNSRIDEPIVAAADSARTSAAPDAGGNNPQEAAPLRAMTFNIRNSRARDGENAWPARRDFVADIIRANRVDVVAMQECLPDQIEDLERRLAEYDWYGVGRVDGRRRDEHCAVFYRRERLEKLEAGEFWLSETPGVVGSKGWDASIARIVTRIVFRDKETGRRIVFYNTHLDHQGVRAREESAKLMLARVRKEPAGSAVIVTGDFNTTAESAPYRILTRGIEGDAADALVLRDARGISRTPPEGPDSTWNVFRAIEPGRRIDFILVAGPVECLSHRILDERRDGRFPSDHLPVLAELRIGDE